MFVPLPIDNATPLRYIRPMIKMNKPYQFSEAERLDIKARLKSLDITQDRLARELNRSRGAIARAFMGERMTLLGRINRWLVKYEQRIKKGAA